MARSKAIETENRTLRLPNGQRVAWRLIRSPVAKKLRIKVRPNDVAVVLPEGRDRQDAVKFLEENHIWLTEQLSRVNELGAVRRQAHQVRNQMTYQGDEVTVRLVHRDNWSGPNVIDCQKREITVICGMRSRTLPSRSLENWLRKKARERIELLADKVGKRLKRTPNRIYVMGQRTKWGNCSSLGNLSFNWRLIMAPDVVLRYVVTHEMVHLAIPDHSRKFWLTVRSLCPDSDRARQWLVAHGDLILSTEVACVDHPHIEMTR